MSPARSRGHRAPVPVRGHLLLRMGHKSPCMRGPSRLALQLLVLSPLCPQSGPSWCQHPILRCHLLLEAPRAGGTAPSQSLVPTTAKGRGTGGGSANLPLAGSRGTRRRKHHRGWLLSAAVLPVCRRFIAVRYEPSSEHWSVLRSQAKLQGLKTAWPRLCRDYLLGSGTDLSLPLPGSVALGKRRCEMLQDLQALGSPPGSPSPSRRSYDSRERLDLLYLCAISLGRYKFLPG